MNKTASAITREHSLLATHTVLRNTYLLLSFTLLFSAFTAWFAMATNAAPMGMILSLVGMFGLLFLTHALKNSAWGILSVFAFTGFVGYMIGPILNMVMHSYSNGGQIITSALASTGAAFLGLSAYALVSKKSFSGLGKFAFVGLWVVIVASILNIWLKMPAVYLMISCAGAFIASALILFDTARIINGGERNYIMATISLYLDLYMLFIYLLNIFTAFSGRNN